MSDYKPIEVTISGDTTESVTLDGTKEFQVKSAGATFNGTLTLSIPDGETVLSKSAHFTALIRPGGNLTIDVSGSSSPDYKLVFTEQSHL